MKEEEVLQSAKKSLSLEQRSGQSPQKSNYDIFRRHVSISILRLFNMPVSVCSKRPWKKGVNLAVPMQAMFKTQSRAKLQSPRHSHLLKKYDGGSPKLTSVIDV